MTPTTAEVIEGLDVGFQLGGQVYVKVHLADRYPGPGEPTLAGLGRDLVVQPQRILAALLSSRAKLRAVNGPALEALFSRYNRIPAMSDEDPPSLSRGAKKEHLRELTTNVRGFVRHGTKALRHDEPSYYDWSLPKHLTIVVPLSEGMVDVIETSRRWTAIKAQIDAFEAKLDQLADAVIGLRKALADLQTVGQRGLHEVGMLVGLSQYCDLLLDQEGNPAPGESPLADFQQFVQRSAIPRFLDQLVCDPVDLAPEAARRKDRFAREIMRILDDPEFVAGARLVVTHHDVVPHALLDNMYHYLTAAVDLLSVTRESDAFAEAHALPMMRGLAELPSKEYEETIEAFEDEELREGMTEGWRAVLPDRDTVFKLAIGIGTGVIGSVSNLEGPRSLGVAVMMQYQIHLFQRAAKTYRYNVAAYERAMSMFFRYFGEDSGGKLRIFRAHLAEAVNYGQKVDIGALAKKAKLDVTRGPFRGRTTRATMALLALAVFGLTLASGPDDSWRSRVTVGATAGTVGIAVLDWGPLADVLERRWKAGVGTTRTMLGGLVGAAGLIASGLATIEAIERGDDLGIIEGALSTVGSASSFAGWALSLRMGALAFAPSLMMTVGSVLIVAGLGITIWRTLSPKEPTDIVNASFELFQEPESRASIAKLEPTVDTLIALASATDFRALGPSYERSLMALGYDQDTIAALRGLG